MKPHLNLCSTVTRQSAPCLAFTMSKVRNDVFEARRSTMVRDGGRSPLRNVTTVREFEPTILFADKELDPLDALVMLAEFK